MNILIFSDNVELVEFFEKKIVDKDWGKSISFFFACSPLSPVIKLKHIKAEVIDLKKNHASVSEKYELIISAHCKQLFPADLITKVRCINIHPGYNPETRGWYPQVFSIIKDLKIGTTIHEMDSFLDNGPIIARKEVEKKLSDTSYMLYRRVLEAEKELILECFFDMVNLTYEKHIPEHEGNVYYKKDFNDLCRIDLNKTGTFLEFYNLLRALSFQGFNNAYILDEENKKIFLNLNIEN